MSDAFYRDLNLAVPHIHLDIESGTHAEQTGGVMIACEKVLIETKPDLLVVVGDVNSTVACTLAAVKLRIKVAHLEAGLRSFDRTMPEEINRIVTDSLADLPGRLRRTEMKISCRQGFHPIKSRESAIS